MVYLSDILEINNVSIVETGKHKEIVENLLDLVKDSPKILDFNALKSAIWEREKIISTGIGLGLAIPHARRDIIKDFTASAILIKKGAEWKSIDDKEVHLAILVGSPLNTHREYLQLLAQTVLLWKDDYNRKKILSSTTKEELLTFLKEIKF